jgi:hypothetical protein
MCFDYRSNPVRVLVDRVVAVVSPLGAAEGFRFSVAKATALGCASRRPTADFTVRT